MASLLEMMSAMQNNPQARYGGGAPGGGGVPTASPDTGLDPAIEAQIQALSQPEPVTALPVPKKTSILAKILGSLANAGGTYGAAYLGRPAPDYVGPMLQSDRSIPQIQAANAQRLASSKSEAGKRGAELRLTALERKALAKQNEEDRKAAHQSIVDERNFAATQQREAITAEHEAARAAAQTEHMRTLRFNAAANGAVFKPGASEDEILTALSRATHEKQMSKEEDKVSEGDKKQFQQDIALLEATVNGNPGKDDGLQALLQSGQITADQAEQIVENKIRWSTLPSPLKEKLAKAAEHYMGHIITAQRMSDSLAAGSPQGTPNTDTGLMRDIGATPQGQLLNQLGGIQAPDILRRLGSVPVPQKY